MTTVVFDLAAYRGEQLQDLNRRVRFLEREQARLERVLGLALEVITNGAACGPRDLLKVLEELEREDTRIREEWLALLRPLPCERRVRR